MAEGFKLNEGKRQWNLFPWEASEEIVKVLEQGLSKYPPDNWKHVENGVSLYLEAIIRHVVQMLKGEMIDKESGQFHSAHIGTGALFITHFLLQERK